jgi:ABC-type transporter lipoprotein component MlaA
MVLAVLLFRLSPLVHWQEPSTGPTNSSFAEIVVLPKSVPDPLEPFNRVMWDFNVGLMTDVIKPTSRVYRFVVAKPVRTGIGNFGRNLTYPGRLINNLLQGKWSGAGDESWRFVCNTTVGVAGFWDVATKWKIPKSDADFGQTFGQWGWKPHFFIMLPLYGPSNDRDTVGLAADTAANPLLYIAPYKFVANDPLTWLGPYTYLSYDKRALPAWTVLASGLVLVCYFFTPPAGAHLSNANVPININYLYGFNDQQPQHWVNENLYVFLWLGALWLAAFLPTHLVLRKIFASPPPAAGRKTKVRFLNICLPASQDWIH